MKIALAALGFKNGDIEYNINVVLRTLEKLEGEADFVVFGESFLQGFDGLVWKYEQDINRALSLNDPRIHEIRYKVKLTQVALSVGLFELHEGKLYDTQITIDKNGDIIHVYRRISKTWKEIFVRDSHYAEGDSFSTFSLMDKTFMVALCGDLWYEEILKEAMGIKSDYLIWPVYLDFSSERWNKEEKHPYCKQAALLSRPTLLVNCYCLDKEEISYYSKGGACYFDHEEIIKEIPSGEEGILLLNL